MTASKRPSGTYLMRRRDMLALIRKHRAWCQKWWLTGGKKDGAFQVLDELRKAVLKWKP